MTPRGRPAGFALPAVIFAMLLLGTLAAAAALVALDVARMGRAAREGVHALYAAEAGLANVRARWPDSIVATLAPGETVTLDPVTLANGDVAEVRIERIDDAATPTLARLLVHSYGRARRAPHAGRHLAFALTLRSSDTACCTGSDSIAGPMREVDSLAREDAPATCSPRVPPAAKQMVAAIRAPATARVARLAASREGGHPRPRGASSFASTRLPPSEAVPRYTVCIPTGVPGSRPDPVPLAERPWIELYW